MKGPFCGIPDYFSTGVSILQGGDVSAEGFRLPAEREPHAWTSPLLEGRSPRPSRAMSGQSGVAAQAQT